MTSNRKRKSLFYVVELIQKPSNDIDDYVCIPHTWMIRPRPNWQKVVVVYPANEAPLVTKDRVRKREKPDQKWKYYAGLITYETGTCRDAENWIETRNNQKAGEEIMEIETSQPEPVVDRPLRSSKNPQLLMKPYEKPRRKPLPKILIRKPLPLRPWKERGDSKQIKLDETSGSTVSVSPESTESENVKQNHPITIIENLLIQRALPTVPINDESTSTSKQATQSGLSKKDQSGHTSVKCTSPKLPNGEQLQNGKQPSSGQGCGQPKSIDVILTSINFNERHIDIEVDQNVQTVPVTFETPSTSKTFTNTLEKVSQADAIQEKPRPRVDYQHSLPKSLLHEISAKRSKEVIKILQPQLHRIVSPPILSGTNQTPQQYVHAPSTPSWKPQLERTEARNFTNTYRQKSPFQGFSGHVPSTDHNIQSPLDLSSPRHIPTKRKNSVSRKPVEKKARLENITRNMRVMQHHHQMMQFGSGLPSFKAPSPTQNHLQQTSSLNYCSNVGGSVLEPRLPLHGMEIPSAVNNLSNLAHQSRFFKQDFIRQYSQHTAHMQQKFRHIQQNIDHRNFLQTAEISRGHDLRNQSHQIHQFHPQHQLKLLPVYGDSMQELIRHEMLKGSIDEAYIRELVARNSGAQNLSPITNQTSTNFDNPENSQYLPNYQDQHTASIQFSLPFESQCESVVPNPQVVTKERQYPTAPETSNQPLPNVIRRYSSRDPRIRARLSQTPVKHNVIYEATTQENIAAQIKPTTQALAAPITSSFDLEIQFFPDVKDSWCQTDEQGSSRQKELSGSKIVTDHDMVSQHEDIIDVEGSIDSSRVEEINKTNDSIPESIREERPIIVQIPTPKNTLQQELMDKCGTILKEMFKYMTCTSDFQNKMRNSLLEYIELYEKLSNEVERVTPAEALNKPSSNVTPVGPQVTKATPVRVIEQENSGNVSRNINSSVDAVPTTSYEQRDSFVLPPEYDPKDSRWTLKYRENKPGLIDLIPKGGVYVNEDTLKKCKEASNDCKSLARLLLTAVFSKNALSVCSLKSEKARPSKPLEDDVRPGLDTRARLVMLAFIEDYCKQRSWTMDQLSITSTLEKKIMQMRTKYGKKG